MNHYLLSILLLVNVLSFGQEYDNVDAGSSENQIKFNESSSILNWKNRLHMGVSNSFFVDFITSPLGSIDIVYTDPGNVQRIEKGATQTSYTSIYSIGFVARYNVLEHSDNLALSLSSPVSVGFGNAVASTESVRGGQGFGNLQIPLFLQFYYGAESTFKSEENIGINFGYGLEWNKIGLLDFSSTADDQDINKPWIMPAITCGAQFYRGLAPMEVNVKYGFGKVEDQLFDEFGNKLNEGKRSTRASSLKITFIYFL